MILEQISSHNNRNDTTIKVNEHSIIKLLPYYYETHIRVGSDAQMAAATTHKLNHSGIYSIYFVVIGRNWLDISQRRTAHDKVNRDWRYEEESRR